MQALLNRLLGERGERAAARHLKRQGMRILLRGYRTKQGEIDLIARDGDTLVFVEVKARRQGVPAEAVTPEKQRRLTNVAIAIHAQIQRARSAQPLRRRGDRLARRSNSAPRSSTSATPSSLSDAGKCFDNGSAIP